jgi:alpha-glucan phosphorylase-like protein
VRASCAFTTHTPVPAGNESFPMEVLDHYMRDYITQEVGIPWENFVDLGFEPGAGDRQNFSMTVLALKMSTKANAVAKLHGKVARDMWKGLWKNMPVEEVPIMGITNGIHTQTWLSKSMRQLFDQHVSVSWGKNEDEPEVWTRVKEIPDEELWNTKQAEKKRFIELIKVKVADDYSRRGESSKLIRETLQNLSSKILTIGFARRFATYKRATLFLRDLERIARILANEDRPVQMIFAGKAHPADTIGKEMIQAIVHASRDPRLNGRLIYLENYDMGIGRLMTRAVDVWMNNPIRPNEASGTSGMKVCPNGGINFSILDGWWDEAWTPEVGWKISSRAAFGNHEQQDEMDALALVDCLEQQIAPLYYMKNDAGFSSGWVQLMKNSIMKLTPQFSFLRMLKEYVNLSYVPVAQREAQLSKDDYHGLKALTAWKQMISSRFPTVEIARVEVRGIRSDELIEAGGELEINMYVRPGKLGPTEIRAEFIIGLRDGDQFAEKPEVIPFQSVQKLPREEGLLFSLRHTVQKSGNYLYAARVVPIHDLLTSSEETGLMCWG